VRYPQHVGNKPEKSDSERIKNLAFYEDFIGAGEPMSRRGALYGRPIIHIYDYIDTINFFIIFLIIVKGTHKGCPYTHDYVFFWVVAG